MLQLAVLALSVLSVIVNVQSHSASAVYIIELLAWSTSDTEHIQSGLQLIVNTHGILLSLIVQLFHTVGFRSL